MQEEITEATVENKIFQVLSKVSQTHRQDKELL
jgi:hypothetical protein